MNKPPKGFIYKSGQGKQLTTDPKTGEVQLVDKDTGKPITNADLQNENVQKQLNPQFQGIQHKFLNIVPYTTGQNTANLLNNQLLLNQASAPLQNQQLHQQLAIQNAAALQQKQALENQANTNLGQSLQSLAAAGNIPYSMLAGRGGNYGDIGRDYQTLLGSYANQGVLAGYPQASANATASLLAKRTSEGQLPYGSQLGSTDIQNRIIQNLVASQYAQPDAQAKLGLQQAQIPLIKARALSEQYVPGGFHLNQNTGYPDQSLTPGMHYETATTKPYHINIPGQKLPWDTGKLVTERKPVSIPASVRNIPQPLTQEEADVLQQTPTTKSIPNPTTTPSAPQPNAIDELNRFFEELKKIGQNQQ